MIAIIPSNIVSSEEQGGGGALAQAAWNPNQMEPLSKLKILNLVIIL